MKSSIHTAHDRFFKKALSNIKIAQEFFETHLSKGFKKHIDLSTLSVEKGSFVDSSLREHLSDMLYKVKIEDRAGYIYVLLEAQSQPDELMAFRLMEYMTQIMRRHIDQQKHSKQPQQLPLIMPLVFYSGTQSASGFKRDIMDCFAQPELARHYFMQPFTLVSMTDTSDDEILQGKLTAAIELIQKHIHARDLTLYLEQLIKVGALRQLYQLDSNLLTSLLEYIAIKGQIKQPDKLVKQLIEHLPQEEKEMATIAQHFEQQGIEKGVQQGMQKGVQKGVQQGKLEMAKNLLALGKLTSEEIAQASELPLSIITTLKK